MKDAHRRAERYGADPGRARGAALEPSALELEQGAEVRVQLHGDRPQVAYFDRTFKLGDDEILLVIAIDRFLRLPHNPTTIVEHTIVRTR